MDAQQLYGRESCPGMSGSGLQPSAPAVPFVLWSLIDRTKLQHRNAFRVSQQLQNESFGSDSLSLFIECDHVQVEVSFTRGDLGVALQQ